ncbi:DUF2164 domain-containing protein [Crenobacter cavernae]|uniref:DUF2164 family protein n=1 Tax=Crenobacter cavernae TaxID=2290923 RepID=A0ABY0FEB6_9NEIS|nr:DUF2164 family protein [Crenobacter cavernae]RXZ44386.1 DUF2164 family protein [Crenobacter cavernae]
MSTPWLPPEQLAALAPELQAYLAREFDVELGGFDAQFVLGFVADKVAPLACKRGVTERFERLQDDLWQLELPSGK